MHEHNLIKLGYTLHVFNGFESLLKLYQITCVLKIDPPPEDIPVRNPESRNLRNKLFVCSYRNRTKSCEHVVRCRTPQNILLHNNNVLVEITFIGTCRRTRLM